MRKRITSLFLVLALCLTLLPMAAHTMAQMTPIKLIRLTKMPDPVIRRMGLLERLVMPSKARASILLRG